MPNKNAENENLDRRDPVKQGSSLSGSNQRDNLSTERALHPDQGGEVTEKVDQDPGERQKENQNREKDDPLAA